MRFIFGLLVGAILVVGAAYVHDHSIDPTQEGAGRPIVNWEAAGEAMRGVGDWIHAEWVWLNEKVRPPG
jgi:hypothetical protein